MCYIYGTLYSNLLDNLTHQLNSVGPDQTPHYAVSHLGSHCLYICPVYEMLCLNRLDGYDVTANVANYDIQSAKSADPDQMHRCYSVVVVIFQNYNLSKRFENLITRRDKIRFSLEKLIIRHVFTCVSSSLSYLS